MQVPMLKPVDLEASTRLVHEAFVAEFPSDELFNALVMRFDGLYGPDGKGVRNARYMEAMTSAYISYTNPWGLIFDFRGLNYQCGKELGDVICIGKLMFPHDPLPTAIVTTPLNAPAFRRLLYHCGAPVRVMHHDLFDALRFVDRTHWSRRSRQEVLTDLDGQRPETRPS